MTSANSSAAPSCDQCRCSHSWQEANSTGVPSVKVMARAVMRLLPQSGHAPEGNVPAWVKDVGLAALPSSAERCWGTVVISCLPGGRQDLICVGPCERSLENPDDPGIREIPD